VSAAAEASRRDGLASHRRLAQAMIAIPSIGTIAALALAVAERGVSALALWLFVLFYIAGVIGIEIGLHRYFSHRSFKCAPGLRLILGILGSMAGQGPVLFWAAVHRQHHRFTDTDADPHAPMPKGMAGFWHAHIGWLLEPRQLDIGRLVPDLVRDGTTLRVNRFYAFWFLVGLLLPTLIGFAAAGWRGALDGFLWGGLVRIFVNHHMTWSVNSVCHLVGQRSYATRDDSRNVWALALPTLGGSWHNNHHAFPASAANDLEWWQFDLGALLIRFAAFVGLAWDLRRPPANVHRRRVTP
jgi:stearoyl-CoA desaturase (Delta-9 desaturase)